MQDLKQRLLKTLDKLIAEGTAVAATEFANNKYVTGPVHFVEVGAYYAWCAGMSNLARLLGEFAEPWKDILSKQDNHSAYASAQLGTLRGIHATVADDLLITAEGLIRGELFNDLLEQAEHLLDQNFWLAAGTLGRAVLEEHLRKWCQQKNCSPSKPKPTLSDYNQSLYAAKQLDKLQMKHVDSMTAVGNDCAHNTGNAKHDDVERLLRDVRDFSLKHPI